MKNLVTRAPRHVTTRNTGPAVTRLHQSHTLPSLLPVQQTARSADMPRHPPQNCSALCRPVTLCTTIQAHADQSCECGQHQSHFPAAAAREITLRKPSAQLRSTLQPGHWLSFGHSSDLPSSPSHKPAAATVTLSGKGPNTQHRRCEAGPVHMPYG
jgi:hypothetical protein